MLECRTLSEIGLALEVLADHCKDYGVTTPDAAELARRAKAAELDRKARLQAKAEEKAKRKAASNSSSRGSSASGAAKSSSRGSSGSGSKSRRFSLTPMKPRSSNRSSRDDDEFDDAVTAANRPRREVKKPDTFTVGHHTPHRSKMRKSQSSARGKGSSGTSTSGKHSAGGKSLFRDFNFFSDRPVREGRRSVNYAE